MNAAGSCRLQNAAANLPEFERQQLRKPFGQFGGRPLGSFSVLRRLAGRVIGRAGAMFCLMLIMSVAAGAARCPEAEIVKQAGAALMAAAHAGSPSRFAGALRTYANMDAITMFALGKYRSKLPSSKRRQLVSLTTSFISRTFNDYRLKFKARSMEVRDCRRGRVTTMFKFLGVQGKQPVIWRLKRGRIVDVNLQNVWLAQLLRTEFYRVMAESQGDIDALFRHLRS